MPAPPESIPDLYENWARRSAQQLAYYTALQSFLTYSFGWSRHDKGLLWWYGEGWPTEDRRLAFMKDIWFFDDTLTGYLAWCARMDPERAVSPLRRWLKQPDLGPLTIPETWASKFREALSDGVWTGGTDPMHLGGGWHGTTASALPEDGLDRPLANARLADVDGESRSATFIADGIHGWYAKLAQLGEALPSLADNRSWRVEVYVRPIGFLGTYRRSRVTGLWFSGQHRYHIVGN